MIFIQTPFDAIKKEVKEYIPQSLLPLLPKKWDKIGSVLIIRIPPKLKKYGSLIGKVYSQHLNCESVLNDRGKIRGIYREPQVDHIYGNPDTETVHVENGIKYKLDPQKIMFSSGNTDERKRMARLPTTGEHIVDLFAGIGYFSLPMAKYGHPSQIRAHEINPMAFHYLTENIMLNNVSNQIQPLIGDNRKNIINQWADRVILGYLNTTKSFLPTAIESLKKKGGIIHYHNTYPNDQLPHQAIQEVLQISRKKFKHYQLVHWHSIKSYAPGIIHMVLDIKVW